MTLSLFAAEISHENAPLFIREKLAANEIQVRAQLEILSYLHQESFIISTCNRFAIYVLGNTVSDLQKYFQQYSQEINSYVRYYDTTEKTVKHLFDTASGLCSQIIGEHQILSQIKQAHQLGLETGSIGPVLDNLLRNAISVGKKVRTQTNIDKVFSSVVDAGLQLVNDKLGNIEHKKFLIIGTGKITRLAIEYLSFRNIKNVMVVSQDDYRAAELADKYKVIPVQMKELSSHFLTADVIIGGTNHEVLVCPRTLSSEYEQEKIHVILDFGMPRNFNDSLRAHPAIELYNLDDIKELYHMPEKISKEIKEVNDIVNQETSYFLITLKELELSPLLSAYWMRLVDSKERELDWLLPKLDNVSDRDLMLIRKFAHKMIRSISHEPFKNIRDWAFQKERDEKFEIVKELYSFNDIKLKKFNNPTI